MHKRWSARFTVGQKRPNHRRNQSAGGVQLASALSSSSTRPVAGEKKTHSRRRTVQFDLGGSSPPKPGLRTIEEIKDDSKRSPPARFEESSHVVSGTREKRVYSSPSERAPPIKNGLHPNPTGSPGTRRRRANTDMPRRERRMNIATMDAPILGQQSVFLNKIQRYYKKKRAAADQYSPSFDPSSADNVELAQELAQLPFRRVQPDIQRVILGLKFLIELGVFRSAADDSSDTDLKLKKYHKEQETDDPDYVSPAQSRQVVMAHRKQQGFSGMSRKILEGSVMLSTLRASQKRSTAKRKAAPNRDTNMLKSLAAGVFPLKELAIPHRTRTHYHALLTSSIADLSWNASRLEAHAFFHLCIFMNRKVSKYYDRMHAGGGGGRHGQSMVNADANSEQKNTGAWRGASRINFEPESPENPELRGMKYMSWLLLEISRLRRTEDSFHVDSDTGFCHHIDNMLAILTFRGREQALQTFALEISRIQESKMEHEKLQKEAKDREKMLSHIEKCYACVRNDSVTKVAFVFGTLLLAIIVACGLMFASWYMSTYHLMESGLDRIQLENLSSAAMYTSNWLERSWRAIDLLPVVWQNNTVDWSSLLPIKSQMEFAAAHIDFFSLAGVTVAQLNSSQFYAAVELDSLGIVLRNGSSELGYYSQLPWRNSSESQSLLESSGSLPTTTTHSAASYDPRNMTWFQQALGSDGQVWAPMRQLDLRNITGISLSRSLRVNDSLVGAMAVDLDLRKLCDLLSSRIELYDKSMVFVSDRSWNVLAASLDRLSCHDGELTGLGKTLRADSTLLSATKEYLVREFPSGLSTSSSSTMFMDGKSLTYRQFSNIDYPGNRYPIVATVANFEVLGLELSIVVSSSPEPFTDQLVSIGWIALSTGLISIIIVLLISCFHCGENQKFGEEAWYGGAAARSSAANNGLLHSWMKIFKTTIGEKKKDGFDPDIRRKFKEFRRARKHLHDKLQAVLVQEELAVVEAEGAGTAKEKVDGETEKSMSDEKHGHIRTQIMHQKSHSGDSSSTSLTDSKNDVKGSLSSQRAAVDKGSLQSAGRRRSTMGRTSSILGPISESTISISSAVAFALVAIVFFIAIISYDLETSRYAKEFWERSAREIKQRSWSGLDHVNAVSQSAATYIKMLDDFGWLTQSSTYNETYDRVLVRTMRAWTTNNHSSLMGLIVVNNATANASVTGALFLRGDQPLDSVENNLKIIDGSLRTDAYVYYDTNRTAYANIGNEYARGGGGEDCADFGTWMNLLANRSAMVPSPIYHTSFCVSRLFLQFNFARSLKIALEDHSAARSVVIIQRIQPLSTFLQGTTVPSLNSVVVDVVTTEGILAASSAVLPASQEVCADELLSRAVDSENDVTQKAINYLQTDLGSLERISGEYSPNRPFGSPETSVRPLGDYLDLYQIQSKAGSDFLAVVNVPYEGTYAEHVDLRVFSFIVSMFLLVILNYMMYRAHDVSTEGYERMMQRRGPRKRETQWRIIGKDPNEKGQKEALKWCFDEMKYMGHVSDFCSNRFHEAARSGGATAISVEILKEHCYSIAKELIESSRDGTNIVYLCYLYTCMWRSEQKYCLRLGVAYWIYRLYHWWVYNLFINVVLLLHILVMFFQRQNISSLGAHGPILSWWVVEIFLLIFEIGDGLISVSIFHLWRGDLRGHDVMKLGEFHKSWKLQIYSAVLLMMTLDWLMQGCIWFSFQYFLPLRPTTILIRNQGTLDQLYYFCKTMYSAAHVFFLFGLVVLLASLMGNVLFHDILNDRGPESSFRDFWRSLITSFAFVGTGENFVEVAYPTFEVHGAYFIFFVAFTIFGTFLVLSITIGSFQSTFAKTRKQREIRTMCIKRLGVIAAFLTLDFNGSSTVNVEDLNQFFQRLRPQLHKSVTKQHVDSLIKDDEGKTTLDMFLTGVEGIYERSVAISKNINVGTRWQVSLQYLVCERNWFKDMVLIVLMCNAWVCAMYGITGPTELLRILSFLCLLFYCCELGIRVAAVGGYEFWNPHHYGNGRKPLLRMFVNRADAIIITLCFGLNVAVVASHRGFTDGSDWWVIFQLLRLIYVFPVTQPIVASLVHLMPQFYNIALFLLVIFFVYGVWGVTLFSGKNSFSQVLQDDAPEGNFQDLASAMATLFQLFVGEAWHDIMYAGISVYDDFGVAAYFISFILIVTIIFANLLIGLVLDEFSINYEEHIQKPESEHHSTPRDKKRRNSWWEGVKNKRKVIPKALSRYTNTSKNYWNSVGIGGPSKSVPLTFDRKMPSRPKLQTVPSRIPSEITPSSVHLHAPEEGGTSRKFDFSRIISHESDYNVLGINTPKRSATSHPIPDAKKAKQAPLGAAVKLRRTVALGNSLQEARMTSEGNMNRPSPRLAVSDGSPVLAETVYKTRKISIVPDKKSANARERQDNAKNQFRNHGTA